jgi:hypothetical protein
MRNLLAVLVLLVGSVVGMGRAQALNASQQAAANSCAAQESTVRGANPPNTNIVGCRDLGLSTGGSPATYPCVPRGTIGTGTTGYYCVSWHSTSGGNNAFQAYSYVITACTAPAQYSVDTHACLTCPAGSVFNQSTGKCDMTCPPEASPLTGGYMVISGPSGGLPPTCSGNCQFNAPSNGVLDYKLIDGVYYLNVKGYIAAGATCSAGTNPNTATPPTDSDGDGVSDTNDTAPNNPGIGTPNPPPPADPQCGTAGHPVCPNDPAATNHSTGGGDCSSPPVSTGDEIAASNLFQNWATRCALVKAANTGTGGQPSSLDISPMTALQAATNAKLDALNSLAGLNATAVKQDQAAAIAQLTNAAVASLEAHNALLLTDTNAKLSAMDSHRTAEINATTDKISAFKDANKASLDATNTAISTLQTMLDNEIKATNIKLDAARDTSISIGDVAHADATAAKSQGDTAHTDAQAIKDAIAALKLDANVTVDMSGTNSRLDTANGILGLIKSGIDGAKTTLDAILGGSDAINAAVSGIYSWLHGADGAADDATGRDVTASGVIRDVDVGTDGLDQSGFGYSRTCPPPVVISVFGHSITFDTDILCNWLMVGGWFVLLITGWRCITMVVNA